MALELIYPFEYREKDLEGVTSGNTTPEHIAKDRGVPLIWVKHALADKHHDLCRSVWKSLPVDVSFPPLPEEGEGAANLSVKVPAVVAKK